MQLWNEKRITSSGDSDCPNHQANEERCELKVSSGTTSKYKLYNVPVHVLLVWCRRARIHGLLPSTLPVLAHMEQQLTGTGEISFPIHEESAISSVLHPKTEGRP